MGASQRDKKGANEGRVDSKVAPVQLEDIAGEKRLACAAKQTRERLSAHEQQVASQISIKQAKHLLPGAVQAREGSAEQEGGVRID